MAGTLAAAVAQAVSLVRLRNYAGGHGLCKQPGMEQMNEPILHDLDLPLDAEIELMDWARAAGVSAEELRRALLGANN